MIHRFVLRSGAFFFRFRNFLFPALAAIVVLLSRPAYFLGSPILDRFVLPLGIGCGILGGAFRLMVIGFAYIKRGGKDGKVYADKLVIEGFYAHVRNPMYVGNILIVLGLGLTYGSWLAYAVLFPFFGFAYYAITVAEEDFLKRKFGADYDAYCAKVNRFIPDFRGIRKSLEGFRYDWRKALRKDYGTFSVMLLGCFGAWQMKRQHLEGLPVNTLILEMAIAAAAVFGAFCGTVRWLKSAGRLRSPA